MDPEELAGGEAFAPAPNPAEAAEEHLVDETDGLERDEAFENEAEGDVLEDIEHDGKTYQVPKALKGAFLRQADYTRKTQELAAQRRSLEAERLADQEASGLKGSLAAIEARLSAAEAVDWDAVWRDDPELAQDLAAHLDELSAAKAGLSDELGRFQQVRAMAEAQEQAIKLHQGHAELSRDIPGWGPEVGARLANFAMTEFGATAEELDALNDPRIVKLLHAAYVGANGGGLSRQAQRHAAAQTSRPAATVGGRASAAKDPSRMSTDEWMRHRNKQLRSRW